MTTQQQNAGATALVAQFALQTRLFGNVLEGITEADAQKHAGESNNITWLAGHLVSTRHMMGALFGITDAEPFPELFADGKGFQAGASYPSLEELKKGWAPISAKLEAALKTLTEDQLNAPAPFPTPAGGNVMAETLAFFAHHEAYTIGQVGILRRVMGYAAMKY